MIEQSQDGVPAGSPVGSVSESSAELSVDTVVGFFERPVLGNPVYAWLIAAAIFVGVFIGLLIVRRAVTARAKAMQQKRPDSGIFTLLAILAGSTSFTLVLAVSLVAGLQSLSLPAAWDKVARWVIVIGVAIQIALWASKAVQFGLTTMVRKRAAANGGADPALETAMPAIQFFAMIVVYTAIGLLALENLGIDVTAMIAGVGIGGIAIALAVQNILGDLFSALSIITDKPFVVGDFIIVGNDMGTVEKIGLKSTRVRSLWGEQLVFRNSDLLTARIRNFKQMQERRVVFPLGVTYQTPTAVVEKIPAIIREVVEGQKDVRFDRAHFKGFGASSLDFEVVFWMLNPDFNTYMDRQQAINLGIMRRFDEMKIEFAYPTQTLYVVGPGAPAKA